MQIKNFNILLIIFFISCNISVEKANFTTIPIEKYFLHQEPHFSISLPQAWDFLDAKDEIDIKLKFSSEDRKINCYLKEFLFKTNEFTLDVVVNDYFSKRARTDFKTNYKGETNGITFYLLEGIFRDVYPIVSIIFVHGKYLYEFTGIHTIDQNELEGDYLKNYKKNLIKEMYNIFSLMRFSSEEYPRLRKRYNVIFPCPKGWDFGLSTTKGEIGTIGYKDKIIVVSLKKLSKSNDNKLEKLETELKKIKLDFVKEMKSKKYKIIETNSKIYNEKAHLIQVSNIPTQTRNTREDLTYSVVKKFYFIKKNTLYELLVVYSMEDITPLILKEIDELINKIKFE